MSFLSDTEGIDDLVASASGLALGSYGNGNRKVNVNANANGKMNGNKKQSKSSSKKEKEKGIKKSKQSRTTVSPPEVQDQAQAQAQLHLSAKPILLEEVEDLINQESESQSSSNPDNELGLEDDDDDDDDDDDLLVSSTYQPHKNSLPNKLPSKVEPQTKYPLEEEDDFVKKHSTKEAPITQIKVEEEMRSLDLDDDERKMDSTLDLDKRLSNRNSSSGRMAIPLPIITTPEYPLSNHIHKLTRFGAYTYSALAGQLKNGHGHSNGNMDKYGKPSDSIEDDDTRSKRQKDEHENDGVGMKGHGRQGRRKEKFGKVKGMDGVSKSCLMLINPSPTIYLRIWDLTPIQSIDSDFPHLNQAQYEADIRNLQTSNPNFNTNTDDVDGNDGMDMASSFLVNTVPRELGCFPRLNDEEGRCEGIVLDVEFVPVSLGIGRVIILTLTKRKQAEKKVENDRGTSDGVISIAYLDLNTGEMGKKVEVGKGKDGEVKVSRKAVVVSIISDNEAPVIYILSTTTFSPMVKPIKSSLALSLQTGLPVFTLNGRLLAIASRKACYIDQASSGNREEGHGTIVTKQSVQRAQKMSAQIEQQYHGGKRPGSGMGGSNANGNIGGRSDDFRNGSISPSSTTHQAIWNTATGLSGEVAKGVWGGLKGLSNVAISTAGKSSGMLSKSAPVASFLNGYGWSKDPEVAESGNGRSISGSIQPAMAKQTKPIEQGGTWIEVFDLCSRSRSLEHSDGSGRLNKPTPIAQFSLPSSLASLSNPTLQSSSPIAIMSFNPLGTHLAVFPEDGRVGAVAEIRPSVVAGSQDGGRLGGMGDAWLRYELLRGLTPARVNQLEWNSKGSLLGVATSRTIHIFAIHPEGGKPTLDDFRPNSKMNVQQLQPLSVKTGSSVRLRPRKYDETEDDPRSNGEDPHQTHQSVERPACILTFDTACRQTRTGGQGIATVVEPQAMAFDPASSILSLHQLRLSAYRKESANRAAHSSTSPIDPVHLPSKSRGWGTLDVLDKAFDAVKWQSSIVGKAHIYRKWLFPGVAVGSSDAKVLMSSATAKRTARPQLMSGNYNFFAAAELITSSTSNKMIPASIYRDKGVDFFGLDRKCNRGEKIRFRESAQSAQEDEQAVLEHPLSTAMQSELDPDNASRMLPAFPNGAGQTKWRPSRPGVLTSARDIVKMRRHSSQQSEEVTSSYGDRLTMDDEGFMNDTGPIEEESTESSEGFEESWEEDLVLGSMEGFSTKCKSKKHSK